MPQKLLDGTNVNFNFQTDLASADITAANVAGGVFPTSAFGSTPTADSWACVATRLSLRVSRQMLIRNTFCNNGWVGRTPSYKDLQGALDGFMSKGSKISDPLYLFSATGAIPMVATVDTGCTLSALIHAGEDNNTIGAGENSSRAVQFMGDGTYIAPMTAWVIA